MRSAVHVDIQGQRSQDQVRSSPNAVSAQIHFEKQKARSLRQELRGTMAPGPENRGTSLIRNAPLLGSDSRDYAQRPMVVQGGGGGL